MKDTPENVSINVTEELRSTENEKDNILGLLIVMTSRTSQRGLRNAQGSPPHHTLRTMNQTKLLKEEKFKFTL